MPGLDDLNAQIRTCQRCVLAQGRTLAVPGEGPLNARIMFIGEAPGFHEDQQGRPFVGAAGQFLEELLASINMSRRQVFIANVVKCRPPNNRDPQPDEIDLCRPYLEQQIAAVRPKVVVTLGRHSMALAFSEVTISQVHGLAKRVGDIIYLPMFHPAAALHQPRYRTLIERDMLKIPAILADLDAVETAAKQAAPPRQLSLF